MADFDGQEPGTFGLLQGEASVTGIEVNFGGPTSLVAVTWGANCLVEVEMTADAIASSAALNPAAWAVVPLSGGAAVTVLLVILAPDLGATFVRLAITQGTDASSYTVTFNPFV